MRCKKKQLETLPPDEILNDRNDVLRLCIPWMENGVQVKMKAAIMSR
ncbi:MAG: hypothetical protein IJ242_12995 [Clostridia bacterium]|nr:hypothetical protein [Clostridia bacterium]